MKVKNWMLAAAGLVCFAGSYGQKGLPAKQVVNITTTTNYPQHVDFSPELAGKLKIPQGWQIAVAATGLGKPRMMAVGAKGELYVTRRDAGDVLMLTDTNGDNKLDKMISVVADFKAVHGIAIHNGWLYLCAIKELRRYPLKEDGSVGEMQLLMNDLPEGGQHPNKTIAFGPDGMLYISAGSQCNDCAANDKEVATMLVADTSTWKRSIFASGLRNTIGFDWHPQTKELWGADNGGDMKGDEWPPEEINKLVRGGNYGWPLVYAKQEVDQTREDPNGTTKEAFAKTTQPSVLEMPAHSAPIDFKFLGNAKGTFAAMANDAIITWHGSWNRKTPSGYKVQLVKFQNGTATGAEDLVTGFLSDDKKSRFGRPAGIAITNGGTVYISDDESGVIYSLKKTN